MLQVEYYSSNKAQNWLIYNFESFQFNDHNSLEGKFIPRPFISIVFHFKNSPTIIEKSSIKLEPFFVGPVISKAIVLKYEKTMDTFIVICKPTVFSKIFNINLSPTLKRSVNLPYTQFFSLWKDLSIMNTTEERIDCFSNFINSQHKEAYIPDDIDFLYDEIIDIKKCITIPLNEMINNYNSCQRTLQRNFIKRTGVSPKVLSRIVRLNYLWDKIKNEDIVDYQDLVFDGNFYDQSHFIKDFKAITGESPTCFFKKDITTAKLFSGKLWNKI